MLPFGSASTSPQTKHLTSVAVLLNNICSFLHFSHRTFINLDFDLVILCQLHFLNSSRMLLEIAFSALCTLIAQVCFLSCLGFIVNNRSWRTSITCRNFSIMPDTPSQGMFSCFRFWFSPFYNDFHRVMRLTGRAVFFDLLWYLHFGLYLGALNFSRLVLFQKQLCQFRWQLNFGSNIKWAVSVQLRIHQFRDRFC